MQHTFFPHTAQDDLSKQSQPSIPQQLRSSVGQDKRARHRARIATTQPAALKNGLRAHELNTKPPRSQTSSNKRQLVKVTLWVNPSVKAELARLADKEQL